MAVSWSRSWSGSGLVEGLAGDRGRLDLARPAVQPVLTLSAARASRANAGRGSGATATTNGSRSDDNDR
jgi:hypothetical protein